jgi:hypothetical protein
VVGSVLPPFGNALRGNFAPSGAVVIDWTHPLTRGLILCRVGDQALDLTGHNPDGNWSPDTNVVSPSTGFEGPSILTNASGSVGVGADMQFGSMPDLQTGGDITFFCRLDIQSTITHGSTYCGFMCYGAGSSNAIYNLAQPTSATTLRFEVQNGSGSYQAATSPVDQYALLALRDRQRCNYQSLGERDEGKRELYRHAAQWQRLLQDGDRPRHVRHRRRTMEQREAFSGPGL